MANLYSLLRLAASLGDLSEIFEISDARRVVQAYQAPGTSQIALSSVASYLANHSVGPGNRQGKSVQNGEHPRFKKESQPGKYSLIEGNEDFENDDAAAEPSRRIRGTGPKAVPDSESPAMSEMTIAADFVKYLRKKPYRALRTTGSTQTWDAKIVEGWLARLNAYEWGGSDWKATAAMVSTFESDLANLKGISQPAAQNREALRIYDDIRKWGNPRGRKLTGVEVMAALNAVWTGSIDAVDSTLTKLYAFACPSTHVIYDSRVAAAILSIAEDIYRWKTGRRGKDALTKGFRGVFPYLGLYPGTGGTRPRGFRYRGWRNAYCVCEAQLDANRLCRAIAAALTGKGEDGKSNWSLREVEAVLFMEGY